MDNKFLALIIGFVILIAFVGVIGVTSDDPELTTAKPEKTTVEVVETTLPPADMTTEPTTEAKKEFRSQWSIVLLPDSFSLSSFDI